MSPFSFTDGIRGDETGDGGYHNPNEEGLVAGHLLYPAGYHSWEHHAQCHETGADCIVGGLLFAGTEQHHEIGEGGESEAVAQLFDGDTSGYPIWIFGTYESKV